MLFLDVILYSLQAVDPFYMKTIFFCLFLSRKLCDGSDEPLLSFSRSVRAFCSKILETESRLHILINNACQMWTPLKYSLQLCQVYQGFRRKNIKIIILTNFEVLAIFLGAAVVVAIIGSTKNKPQWQV